MDKYMYNLTPAQAVMYLSMKYSLQKQVINVPTSMLIQDEIDFELLQQAIELEVKRNDALRLRFEKSGGTVSQYFEAPDEAQTRIYEVKDFTGFTEEEQNSVLSQLAGKAFKIYKETPYNLVMIKSYDGYCGVFFNVNHLIMDSFAVMIFYRDLFQVYYALRNGTELPKPLVPYEELLKKELAYQGSDREKADMEFFKDLYENETEPILAAPYGMEPLIKARKKDPNARSASTFSIAHTKVKQKVFRIEKGQMEEMFRFCKEQQVPFQCLFAMGIRTYLSLVNEHEKDITFNATVARRATLAEKRSAGTRIHFLGSRSIAEDEDAFIKVVRQIAEYQNSCFRHVDLDPQKMWAIQGEVYSTKGSYAAMSFTYQPVAMDLGLDADIRTKWHSPGYASNPLYITIMHNISHAGGLDVYYEYQSHLMTEENIESFQQTVMRTMELGLQNPQITVGEIFEKL